MPKLGKAPLLTERQVKTALAMCTDRTFALRDRAILLVSHKMGLRAKEIAGLLMSDVLDDIGELVDLLRLRAAITKGAKYGEVPLSNLELRQALTDYVALRAAQPRYALAAPLFVSRTLRAMSPDVMQKLVKRIYAHAGISATSHSGRRTFANRILSNDGSIKDVQVLLRHNNIAQSATYLESATDRMAALVRKV